jgi:alpha-mannosidase
MHVTIEQRLDLLGERTEEVNLWRNRATVDIEQWTFDGSQHPIGERWPELDGVHTLRSPGAKVPDVWPLDESLLELDIGGEALLTITYADNGAVQRFGLDPMHSSFPLDGRVFDIDIQAVARHRFGEPNREARIAHSRLVWRDTGIEDFARRLKLIIDLARTLGSDPVVEPLIRCAERALNGIRWPSSTHEYISRAASGRRLQSIWSLPADLITDPPGLNDQERATVVAADERLRRDLAALQTHHQKAGALALSGHAHLDLAWLWPVEETRRKAVRTYHTVVNLMDRHPELTFNQSSAQLYAFIEEDDPELFERIKDMVGAGRWEPIGAMWVEPDMKMLCGESIVRQLLYGQRYFKRNFGSYHAVCWLPDCFGFSPALPQLLLDAGIRSFFTCKLNWSETNRFPYDLFWWDGLDGSRILAHSFHSPIEDYNGDVIPQTIVPTWRNFRGKRHHHESLYTIGHGDGGGGPAEGMLQRARALEDFPAVPSLRWTTVHEFFDRLHEGVADEDLPVWVGELNLELHRGTFTTQARTKYLHRRAERDLTAAEVLSAMNALDGRNEPASLEDEWRILLKNQFHDILPGSSIREVYETAEAELGELVDRAGKLIAGELEELGRRIAVPGDREGVIVFNPDLTPRPLRAEVDARVAGAQEVEDGAVLTDRRAVGGLAGMSVLDIEPQPGLAVSATHLENEYVRVELNRNGTIDRILDKAASREVLSGRGNQLWAFVDKPRDWDAWDVDARYADSGEEIHSADPIEVIESGPHRAAVRVHRRFRNSTIVQDVRLWSNSPRVDFKTTLEWGDRRWLLKALFPLAVKSDVAVSESAFGVVERSTHRNTSWQAAQFEVAGHRFVDLSEPGYGVALLNDGRYGHHAMGSELGLSLLRSPIYPDPYADEGHHSFTYALFPHSGSWVEGGVLAEAEDLNRPLLCRRAALAEESTWQPIRVHGPAVGLGALKVLEDGGGLVLRCYEVGGGRGEATVDLPPGWRLDAELDLLENRLGTPQLTFTPFKVRSWSLTR